MADTPISFISYSRTNTDFVDRLEKDLKKHGFFSWVDRGRIEGGDEWLDIIQAAIESCPILLLVLSPEAIKSKYVKIEYRYALHLDKLVIPLHHQQCAKVPMDLNGIHWINFLTNYDEGLKDLLKALNHYKSQEKKLSTLPSSPISHQKLNVLATDTKEPPLVTPRPAPPLQEGESEQAYKQSPTAPKPTPFPGPPVSPTPSQVNRESGNTTANSPIAFSPDRNSPILPLTPQEPDFVPETPARQSRASRQLPVAPAAAVAVSGAAVGGALAGATISAATPARTATASATAPARNPVLQSRPVAASGAGVGTLASQPSRVRLPPRGNSPGRVGYSRHRSAIRIISVMTTILVAITTLFRIISVLLTIILVIIILSIVIPILLNLSSSGTITITPNSQFLQNTYTLAGTTSTDVKARTIAIRSITIVAQSTPLQVDATGIQEAGNYTFLQQSDATNAVTQQTKDSTRQDAMNNLRKQLHAGEQILGTTQCAPTITANHFFGDNGPNNFVNSATIIYHMKCTVTSYDYAGAQLIVSGLLAQQAATTLPRGYTPVSNIQVSLNNQTTTNNKTSFFFSGKGLWAYQFSNEQKLNIAKSIAGKSVAEAQAILKNTPGVGDATVTTSGGNLPSDPNQLSIQIPSLTGSTADAPVTTPTISPPNIAAPVVQGGVGSGGN